MVKVDFQALKLAMLRELRRQEIEFAQIRFREDRICGTEHHIIVLLYAGKGLRPAAAELLRIDNQLKEE